MYARRCTGLYSVLALLLAVPVARSALPYILEESYDRFRTSANLNEVILNRSTVSPETFGKLWTYPTDGKVNAMPLYVPQLDFGGSVGVRNALYVATMNGVVYCFDADRNATIWQYDVRDPVERIDVVSFNEIQRVGMDPNLPGNVIGNIGILATPIIDLPTRTIYFVCRTKKLFPDGAGNFTVQYRFELHARDIVTGLDKYGTGRVMVNGTTLTATNRYGVLNKMLPFDAYLHNNRPGLAIARDQIWIAFGAIADRGAYRGWVMTYDMYTMRQTSTWVSTKSSGAGGIWQSGRAPPVDDEGHVYYETGNGDFDGVFNFGQSFFKLSFENNNITVADYYLPTDDGMDWRKTNGLDYDVGSTGMMLIPDSNMEETPFVLGSNKLGTWYILNKTAMGGAGINNTNAYQTFANRGRNELANYVKNNYGYYPRGGCLGSWLYVWAEKMPMNAYHFNGAKFNPTPVSSSAFVGKSGTSSGGVIAISADGSKPGTGIVWATIPDVKGGAEARLIHGVAFAFDAEDLSKVLWNTTIEQDRDDLGIFAKHVHPVVANGRVYISSFTNSGTIIVYGLLNPNAPAPPPPPPPNFAPAANRDSLTIFDVTVAPKTPCAPNYGRGSAYTFRINDTQTAELWLPRNQTYLFRLNVPCTYPFYLTRNVSGGPYDPQRITAGVVTTAAPFPVPSGLPVSMAPLREPQVISCQNSEVTLTVVPHRWNIDGQIEFTTRAYAYNGVPQLPGPTIVMKAGTQCRVTIVNSLSKWSPVANCSYHSNSFHCPDTTNLHTHGLHISSHQDDVGTVIKPNEQLTYTYDVPADHLMGTMWYHAHHHGSVTLQVLGGLVGALLVEPADDYVLPSDLAPLYEDPKTLVLQHVFFGGTDTGTTAGFTMMDYSAVSASYTSATEAYESYFPNAYFRNQTLKNIYAVNGQYQPVVALRPNHVTLLRLINAGATRFVELELNDPSGFCQWKIIARDGVFQPTPYWQPLAVVLASGNRADVAIKCSPGAGMISVASRPSPVRDSAMGTENRHSQAVVFWLSVADDGQPANPVFPTSAAPLPAYLSDLLSEPVARSNITHILLSAGTGVLQNVNLKPFPGFEMPESERYIDRVCLGEVYEYSVVPPGHGFGTAPAGKTSAHPYHQHVNHFQISGLNGVNETSAADVVRIGEWRDTVPAFAPNGVKIRYKPLDFTGDMVLHCHILQHEDRGMMALIKLADENDLPSQCVGRRRHAAAAAVAPAPKRARAVPIVKRQVATEFVDVGDNYFEPEVLTIVVGTTVRWTMSGAGPHTVTTGVESRGPQGSYDFEGFLGTQGAYWEYTFNDLGEINYFCIFHPMYAQIVVVPQPAPTTAVPSLTTAGMTTSRVPAPPPPPPIPSWANTYCNGLHLYFRPDHTQPNTIYYQSFYDMDVGYRINLLSATPAVTTAPRATTASRTTSVGTTSTGTTSTGTTSTGTTAAGTTSTGTTSTGTTSTGTTSTGTTSTGTTSTGTTSTGTTSTGTTASATTAAAPVAACDNFLDISGYGALVRSSPASRVTTGPMTMSCWINLESHTIVDQTVIWNGAFSSNGQGLMIRVGGTVAIGINGVFTDSTYAVPLYQWIFLSAVQETPNVWKIYANGVLQSTVTVVGVTVKRPDGKLAVGGHGGSYNGPDNGNLHALVDNVMIWETARTAAQLSTIDMVPGAITGFETGLATFLPMNEGAGDSAMPVGNGAAAGALVARGVIAWGRRCSSPEPVTTGAATTSTGTTSTGTTSTGTTSTGTTSTGTTSSGSTSSGTTGTTSTGTTSTVSTSTGTTSTGTTSTGTTSTGTTSTGTTSTISTSSGTTSTGTTSTGTTSTGTTSTGTTSTGTTSTGTTSTGTTSMGSTLAGTTAAVQMTTAGWVNRYAAFLQQGSTGNGWRYLYQSAAAPGVVVPISSSVRDNTLKGKDATYARCLLPAAGATSAYLFISVAAGTNSVPVDATVTGLRVQLTRKATAAGVQDLFLGLFVGGAVQAVSNQCGNPALCPWPVTTSTTLPTANYGNASYTWGLALTPSMINDDTFGVAVRVQNIASPSASVEALLDWLQYTVYYTVPVAPPPPPPTTSTGTTSSTSSTGTTSTGTTSTGTTSTGTTSTGTSSTGTTSTGTTSTGTTSTGTTAPMTTAVGTTGTTAAPVAAQREKSPMMLMQDSSTAGWAMGWTSGGSDVPVPVATPVTDSSLFRKDGTMVRVVVPAGGTSSQLVIMGYGNAVPTAGTTITGLSAYIQRRATAAGLVDVEVSLMIGGVIQASSNQCPTGCAWSPTPTTLHARGFGGNGRTWNVPELLTPASVNANRNGGHPDNGFGVVVRLRNSDAVNAIEAFIDSLSVTVYYTTAPGSLLEGESQEAAPASPLGGFTAAMTPTVTIVISVVAAVAVAALATFLVVRHRRRFAGVNNKIGPGMIASPSDDPFAPPHPTVESAVVLKMPHLSVRGARRRSIGALAPEIDEALHGAPGDHNAERVSAQLARLQERLQQNGRNGNGGNGNNKIGPTPPALSSSGESH